MIQKRAINYLSKYLTTDNQKKALNTLIDLVNHLEAKPDSRIIDIMLLQLFLNKYIETENPELAISEVMKDITDGHNLSYQLDFAKYNIAHQIQYNQKEGINDNLDSFLPLVNEVLETMKNQIEFKI